MKTYVRWQGVRVFVEISLLAILLVGGTLAQLLSTGPVKPPHAIPHSAITVTAPVAKHVAKATTAPPSPPPAPSTVTKPSTPAPRVVSVAPRPIPANQPAPGSSVKKLVPSPTTSSTGTAPTVTSPTPTAPVVSSAPAPASGGYSSTNWAGYAALTGAFTAVSGSWTVPSVTGDGTETTGDAAWIGIGGVSSQDLIQTGTSNSVDANGHVSTYVFYEMLPDAELEVTSFPVEAGDIMTATITEALPGTWRISITDVTTGQNFTTTVQYTSTHSSAEWIEEDPSYMNGSLVPFDNFNHVVFSGGNTTMNSAAVTISGSNADPITLVKSGGQPVVTPSVLISSGTGFWATHN